MTTRLCLAGALLAGAMELLAADTTFWRISSASTTVITTIDINGTLSWSNSVPGNNEQVQRATMSGPFADWQDYVTVPATNTATSVKAFELNAPAGMVLIPAGSFVMGNATNVLSAAEGEEDELPQHTIYVSAFYMDRYEATKALWDEVKMWAETNGYVFTLGGWGQAIDHPVVVTWWTDCVKWCNARSEKDGLTPCYTTNGVVYRVGNEWNVVCNWAANGYRLPTEAEWEKAARGGVANHRFPWSDSDTIQHARANYNSSSAYAYDTSPTRGYHPTFNDGFFATTSPVGSFAANSYGLCDMAGNVWEWCWDWYSSSYYNTSPGTDPRGAPSGSRRVLRGGCDYIDADRARVASRDAISPSSPPGADSGFRCARGL